MKINEKGIALIKKFEGCKLKAYKCSAGVPTIGYGATFYEDGAKVKMTDVITQQRADELLTYHIGLFSAKVKPLIKSAVNDNQFSALVSFAYNVGVGALSKSTLLKKVNANHKDTSIAAEFAKLNKAGGKVWKGLESRRAAEGAMYYTI